MTLEQAFNLIKMLEQQGYHCLLSLADQNIPSYSVVVTDRHMPETQPKQIRPL